MLQKPRICYEVIDAMIALIPKEETLFIEMLESERGDSLYKSIEETSQWTRLAIVVKSFINPSPIHDWEFLVLSVFTTLSVEELKEIENTRFY